MLIHRLRTMRMTATVIAMVIALLAVTGYQGASAQEGQAPQAPANPMAHLIAGEGQEPQVRISWDAPPEGTVTGHTVSRNDGQSFEVPGGATTYGDRAILPGTAYSYTVTAENAVGSSPASTPATAQVPPAPSTPGDFAGSVGEPTAADTTPTVTLTWTASTVPEAATCETAHPLSGYTITRTSGNDTTEIGSPGSGDTSFTDRTAAFSATYTYRIHARSAVGNSPDAEIQVTVPTRPVDPPTSLTASIADPFDGNISLSWDPPAQGPVIIGYMALRYLGADPHQGSDTPVIIDPLATGTTLVDGTAEAGVTYSYIVIALSTDNVSVSSNTVAIEAPAPPAGLTAAAGDGAIDLSWPASAGTPGTYRVERQEPEGRWQNLTDTAAITHRDTTATGNTAYIYRVQHRNQHGGSAWTQSGSVTLVLVPGSPTGLTATADGSDNVLTWTAPDSPFIDGYRVRHSSGEGEWAILANDVAEDTLTHTHQQAEADVTHHYAVLAHNSAGDGPWSDTASTNTITPPLAPRDASVALDGDDITLTWTRPDSVHVDGYTVRHQAGTGQAFVESGRLTGTATSYTIEDITGDTIYTLSVRAHNDGGDSPWSEQVEIERVLLPTAPASVSVATDDQNITLTWSEPETGRVAGYHVSYGIAESEARQTANIDAGQNSFVHSDSVEGAPYAYQVRAHNSAGNGPWSEPVQATRLLTPGTPTDLKAAASAGVSAISITWQAPAGSIVATYEVEYGLSSGTERVTASVSGEHSYFAHTGSDGDVEYQYRVRAGNAAGNSPWTGAVTATRVLPPGKPTDVDAAISGSDIAVTWTAPDSVFIDGYHVELRQSGLEKWTRHTVTGATSFTHESPDAGTPYQYRVRTHNAGGYSPWSPTAEAIWYQGAAPPTTVSVQPWSANTQLLVRWTASQTNGVTGYQVRHRIDGGDWSTETTSAATLLVFHDWDSGGEDLREYSVRSQKDDVYGDWSAIRRFNMTTPGAVTNVVASVEGSNGVRLHWEEPDTGQPTQYFIEYNTGSGTWVRTGFSAGYQRTHRFASQPYESTYSYRVMAVNDVMMTGVAGETSVTMRAQPQNFTNMPAGLAVKMLDGDRVRLTWSAPADSPADVNGYRIYRQAVDDASVSPSFEFNDAIVLHTGSTGTRYVDLTAEEGQMYAYAVAAYRPSMGNRLSPASHPAYARPW